MLEFRRRADAVLKQVVKGQAFVLTYRGKPVARLEPVKIGAVTGDDPIYQLDELASAELTPLSNPEIDRAIYGS